MSIAMPVSSRLLAGAALAWCLLIAPPALAQGIAPVERNLPPTVTGQGRLIIGPQDLAAVADDTPMGVELAGVTLIAANDAVDRHPAAGIRIGAIGDISRTALETALLPFLGQSLSRKRIGDIQAAIAGVYRAAGYPFVSVVVPPQEVTGGVLVLRVVEFRIGSVKVSGAEAGTEAGLASRVRAAPGDRISAEALDEDLIWLNRNPYRSVNGVFSPGDGLGLSTLNLEVTQQKPWQVFAGYSNSGTHTTSLDRYFVGFGVQIPGLPESFLSYQVTGSANFWSDPDSVGTGPRQPSYYSQAGRLVISTGPRQTVEIAPNYAATRQNAEGTTFAFDNTTLEIPVYYRTAISNLLPGVYAGDLILGASAKMTSRSSYFAGQSYAVASAELFELILGWSATRADGWGSTSLSVKLTGNPGEVLGGNNAAHWRQYSLGRVTDATYIYGLGDLSRLTRLPAGFTWVSDLFGLAADQAMPDPAQLNLGGVSATRGYTLDDATVDTGVVWRNELRMPAFPLLSSLGFANVTNQVSPYAILDVSWGRLYGYRSSLGTMPREDYSLAGTGLGVDYTINRNLTATLVGGVALADAIYTKAGDFNLQARIYLSY